MSLLSKIILTIFLLLTFATIITLNIYDFFLDGKLNISLSILIKYYIPAIAFISLILRYNYKYFFEIEETFRKNIDISKQQKKSITINNNRRNFLNGFIGGKLFNKIKVKPFVSEDMNE